MEFHALDARPGLAIFDPVENARFEVYTPTPVEPTSVSGDGFQFPVDTAIGFDTTAIEIPNHISAVVRQRDGTILADETTFDHRSLQFGTHLLELQSTPMKLYVAFEGAPELNHANESLTVTFDRSRPVRVGARSFHERPGGTITVPEDVRAEMSALSLLGSALKTTTCERSFPTLRGQPPRIEHGGSFDVPSEVESPDTGVELVLPPEREYVYPAASLAYYLGANVVAGSSPRLVAGKFEYSLSGEEDYTETINRVLRQVFFLDCLTRTEGHYQVELHERRAVEPLVDLDFSDLYGRPLAEQLPAYLSVPYDVLDSYIPDWHLTTDVVPVAENLAALSHFAGELSLLRTPENPTTKSVEPKPDGIEAFTRATAVAGDFTRATSDDWDWDDDEMFQVESAATTEHAWVGNGYPIGANKVTLDSLRRPVEQTSADSTLEIHVVNNDERMSEEAAVSDFYGLRDFMTFDVSIHESVSTTTLGALFESSADFLHYIGHVDEEGFRCTDGYLDADSLGDVNVDAFLLNACQSYRQGELLVEKGSRGGVVTLAEIINSTATTVGRTMARLLNCGFSLRAALSIATDELVAGAEYITIGDGGLTLCQGVKSIPTMYRIRAIEEEYILEHGAFPTSNYGMGTLVASKVKESPVRYIASKSFAEFRLSPDELDAILEREILPVMFEGDLHWSNEISVSDL